MHDSSLTIIHDPPPSVRLSGDPDNGSTRVVTQNRAGATFWVGKQPIPGGKFTPLWNVRGAVGHYDYGALSMARTLGSDNPNQVAAKGRRVLVGWVESDKAVVLTWA